MINKIKVVSDGNELEFQNVIKGYSIYKYTKSKTKKDQLIGFTDQEIAKLLKNNIIAQIK